MDIAAVILRRVHGYSSQNLREHWQKQSHGEENETSNSRELGTLVILKVLFLTLHCYDAEGAWYQGRALLFLKKGQTRLNLGTAKHGKRRVMYSS
jgi:hypothetical protein